MYASDSDGLLPPVGTCTRTGWIEGTEELVEAKGDPKRWRDLVNHYTKNESVFYCPSDPRARTNTKVPTLEAGTTSEFTSYLVRPVKGMALRRDGSTRLVLDQASLSYPYATDQWLMGIDEKTKSRAPYSVHGDRVNCLFLDGGVKSYPVTVRFADVNRGGDVE